MCVCACVSGGHTSGFRLYNGPGETGTCLIAIDRCCCCCCCCRGRFVGVVRKTVEKRHVGVKFLARRFRVRAHNNDNNNKKKKNDTPGRPVKRPGEVYPVVFGPFVRICSRVRLDFNRPRNRFESIEIQYRPGSLLPIISRIYTIVLSARI